MPRLILTLAQARALQAETWPSHWAFLLDIATPEQPDNLLDPERATAGLRMIALGCEVDQIGQQLNLHAKGSAMRQLFRLHKRGNKA